MRKSTIASMLAVGIFFGSSGIAADAALTKFNDKAVLDTSGTFRTADSDPNRIPQGECTVSANGKVVGKVKAVAYPFKKRFGNRKYVVGYTYKITTDKQKTVWVRTGFLSGAFLKIQPVKNDHMIGYQRAKGNWHQDTFIQESRYFPGPASPVTGSYKVFNRSGRHIGTLGCEVIPLIRDAS